MAEFVWRAAQSNGDVLEGHSDADNNLVVLKQLRDRGLTPIRIEGAAQASGWASTVKKSGAQAAVMPHRATATGRAARAPVDRKDVLAFTAELAIMLRAGLALDNALRVLIEMAAKPSVGKLLQQVLDDVKGGVPFSKALGRERELFGDFYINMVRSGEASGQLSEVLTRLVEHLERLRALRESVVSATIYPMILLGVAVLSVIAMLGFVVPQFEKLFTDMGDALPLPTRIVMLAGRAFTDYGLWIGAGVALVIWLLMRWFRSPAGRDWWQALVLRMPIIGGLMLKYQLTLFARSLGTLLGNGVPMLAALRIASETVANLRLRKRLESIAPAVKEGSKVVQAMIATQIFEPLAINLVRVGEETGRIGAMMLELATILNREVETGIKRSLTLVEPVLILVLGILIASIIVSILLGILSVNDLAV